MECERHDSALSDAALGARADAGLERHLTECARCRATLDERRRFAQSMDGVLAAALDVAPSPALRAGLMARVAAAERRVRGASFWVPAAAIAAAAIAFVVFRGARGPTSAPLARHGAGAERTTSSTRGEKAADPARGALSTATARETRRTPLPRRVTGGRAAERRAPPAAPVPPVVVPPGEGEAIARLLEVLRDRRVGPGSLLTAPLDARKDLHDPGDLEIAPLAIEPLVLARLETIQVWPSRPQDDDDGWRVEE